MQISTIETGCGVNDLVKPVGISLQAVFVQCGDIVRQTFQVQVKRGGGAIVFVAGLAATAGAQQVHWKSIYARSQLHQLVPCTGTVPGAIQIYLMPHISQLPGKSLAQLKAGSIDSQAE